MGQRGERRRSRPPTEEGRKAAERLRPPPAGLGARRGLKCEGRLRCWPWGGWWRRARPGGVFVVGRPTREATPDGGASAPALLSARSASVALGFLSPGLISTLLHCIN